MGPGLIRPRGALPFLQALLLLDMSLLQLLCLLLVMLLDLLPSPFVGILSRYSLMILLLLLLEPLVIAILSRG
jgi:hypothetical protein